MTTETSNPSVRSSLVRGADYATWGYTWGLDLSGLSGNATSAGIHGAGVVVQASLPAAGIHGAGVVVQASLPAAGIHGAGVVVQASLPAAGIHGAGGIGGLLAVCETQGTPSTSDDASYWYCYDGNGNVGQILATTKDGQGSITGVASTPAARYEYDPYGNVIGPDPDGDGDWQEHATAYALANPIRFSTRPFDPETGAGCWPARYYLPRLGRWMSRDPMEERGGRNLYAFLRNRAFNRVDPAGQSDDDRDIEPPGIPPPGEAPGDWDDFQCACSKPGPCPCPPASPHPKGFFHCSRYARVDPTDGYCTAGMIHCSNCVCAPHQGILYWGGGWGLDRAYGWGGANNAPGDETKSWQSSPPSNCTPLRCSREMLQHGKGSGKLGCTASDDEILDCLANTPKPPGVAIPGWNDCSSWVKKAKAECGLR